MKQGRGLLTILVLGLAFLAFSKGGASIEDEPSREKQSNTDLSSHLIQEEVESERITRLEDEGDGNARRAFIPAQLGKNDATEMERLTVAGQVPSAASDGEHSESTSPQEGHSTEGEGGAAAQGDSPEGSGEHEQGAKDDRPGYVFDHENASALLDASGLHNGKQQIHTDFNGFACPSSASGVDSSYAIPSKINHSVAASRILTDLVIWLRDRNIPVTWVCNGHSSLTGISTAILSDILGSSSHCEIELSFALRQALTSVLEYKSSNDDMACHVKLDAIKEELKHKTVELDTAERHAKELSEELADTRLLTAVGGEPHTCKSTTDTADLITECRSELKFVSDSFKEANDRTHLLEEALSEKTKRLTETEALYAQALTRLTELHHNFETDNAVNAPDEVFDAHGKADDHDTTVSHIYEPSMNQDLQESQSLSTSSSTPLVHETKLKEEGDSTVNSKLLSSSIPDNDNISGGRPDEESASAKVKMVFSFARICAVKLWSLIYPILRSCYRRASASRLGVLLENMVDEAVLKVKHFLQRVDRIFGTSLEQQHNNIVLVIQILMFILLIFALYLLLLIWRGACAISRACISAITGSSNKKKDNVGRMNVEVSTPASKGYSTSYQGISSAADHPTPEPVGPGSDQVSTSGYNMALHPNPPSVPLIPTSAGTAPRDDPQSKNNWTPPSFSPSAHNMIPLSDEYQMHQKLFRSQGSSDMNLRSAPMPPQMANMTGTSRTPNGQAPAPNRVYGSHSAPPHMLRPGAPRTNNLLPPHVAPGRAQGRGIPGRGPPRRFPGRSAFGGGRGAPQPPFMSRVEDKKFDESRG